MIRKDYILKLVEQFALMLSKLMGLKLEGDYKGAIETIDHFLKKNTKLDLVLLNHLSVEQLESMLESDEMKEDQWTFVADTLFEESEIRSLMNEEDACFDSRQKTFLIYSNIIKNYPQTFSLQMMGKIDSLITYLQQFSLHPQVHYHLFLFWIGAGKYAKAEDVLFEMIDQHDAGEQVIKDAVKIYEGLLELDNEKLEAGDLPREELVEGLKNLKSKNFIE